MKKDKSLKVMIPYSPRPVQQLLHNSTARFMVAMIHRRMGKTVWAINHIVRKALHCTRRRPQYAYIAPSMKQAKRVSWDYVKYYTGGIPDVKYNESELKCTLPNGAVIYLLGAEDPSSLRGMYLDGTVMDEVGQMPKEIWSEVVRPALSDRQGWAIFIGTVKGENFFTEMYDYALSAPGWQAFNIRASDTKIIPQAELDDALATMGEAKYMQEYENDRNVPVSGAYYQQAFLQLEDAGRIDSVPYNEMFPVITAWDLGYNDATVIWFAQVINDEIKVIDFYTDNNHHTSHYLKYLKSKPYTYEYHILPHDARSRSVGQRNSIEQQFKQHGYEARVLKKALSVKPEIEMVRAALSQYRFDRENCIKGIIALKNYRSEYNERLGTYSDSPRHDEFSHAADAFRYLVLGLKTFSTSYSRRRNQGMQGSQKPVPYDPLEY